MSKPEAAEWKQCVEHLYKGIDAQKVSDEIARIGDNATPAQIVEAARDSGTELHKCFEWDDSKAAEKYRLQQARHVVCHLVIRETVAESRPPVRVYMQPSPGSGYQPTKLIVRNQDAYQSLLQTAYRELSAFRNKYSTLSELEEVLDAIDRTIK